MCYGAAPKPMSEIEANECINIGLFVNLIR